MAGFAVGGSGGLKQADASALMAKLRGSAAPANPMTPTSRQSPSDERLEAYAKVRKSLELVERTLTPDEMALSAIISGMRVAIHKLLQGLDPQEVVSGIAASLGAGSTPPVPTPAAPPAAPMGPTAGPQPQGAPPQPGAPVSPGNALGAPA